MFLPQVLNKLITVSHKQIATERGALAWELFVVKSESSGDPERIKQNLPDHLRYQAEQEQAGHLVLAGPVSDESGEQMEGSGLIVYRANSLEQARTIAENDPMHLSGARVFTIQCWLINEGSLQISLKLSSQSIALT